MYSCEYVHAYTLAHKIHMRIHTRARTNLNTQVLSYCKEPETQAASGRSCPGGEMGGSGRKPVRGSVGLWLWFRAIFGFQGSGYRVLGLGGCGLALMKVRVCLFVSFWLNNNKRNVVWQNRAKCFYSGCCHGCLLLYCHC